MGLDVTIQDFLYRILTDSILHPAPSADGVFSILPSRGTSVALGRGQRCLLRVPKSLD
jgi:hypothetical protein